MTSVDLHRWQRSEPPCSSPVASDSYFSCSMRSNLARRSASRKARALLLSAASLAQRAARLAPEDVRLHWRYASLLCDYRADRKCTEALEAVLQIEPTHEEARARLSGI